MRGLCRSPGRDPGKTDSPEGRKHSSSNGAKAEVVSKEEYYSENPNSTLETGAGAGTDLTKSPTDNADVKSEYVEGYEMTKEKIKDKVESENMPFSASDLVADAFPASSGGSDFHRVREEEELILKQ